MTVAFEFEEKKEDDENAGKVKVNLSHYAFFFSSVSFCFFTVVIQVDLCTNWVVSAKKSDVLRFKFSIWKFEKYWCASKWNKCPTCAEKKMRYHQSYSIMGDSSCKKS